MEDQATSQKNIAPMDSVGGNTKWSLGVKEFKKYNAIEDVHEVIM